MSVLPHAGRTPVPSSFVNGVAWTWIVWSGLSTLIAIGQNVLMFSLFSAPRFRHGLETSSDPTAAVFLHLFPWFFIALLLLSATTLTASIALLRRRNWGRLLFIAMLFIAIAWQVGGFIVQQGAFHWMESQGMSPDVASTMQSIRIVSVVFAVALSILLGWIIKRLLSPEIVAEFKRA